MAKDDKLSYTVTFGGKKRPKDNKTQSCVVLISLQGNVHCTGEFFKETLIKSLEVFSYVAFLIVDEPNKYNLNSNLERQNVTEENEAKTQALLLGSDWLNTNIIYFSNLFEETERNKIIDENYQKVDGEKGRISIYREKIKLINKLSKDQGKGFEIFNWESWVSGEEERIDEVRNFISTSEVMQKAIENTAAEYARRHAAGNHNVFPQKLELSKAYLTHETAAIIFNCLKKGLDFIAYPGKIIAPFQSLFELVADSESLPDCIKNVNKKQINWLQVNFKKSKKNNTPLELQEGKDSSSEIDHHLENREKAYFLLVMQLAIEMPHVLREQGFSPSDIGVILGSFTRTSFNPREERSLIEEETRDSFSPSSPKRFTPNFFDNLSKMNDNSPFLKNGATAENRNNQI